MSAWKKEELLGDEYLKTAKKLIALDPEAVAAVIDRVTERDEELPTDPVQLAERFRERSPRIRKLLASVDTILDLLIYFSDTAAVLGLEHHERVSKFKALLQVHHSAYGNLGRKLATLTESPSFRRASIKLLLPILTNVSLQSFSIFSELRALEPLLTSSLAGDVKGARDSLSVHLMFLTSPMVRRFEEIIREENAMRDFFSEYKDRRKMASELIINANALRIRSFVVQYLIAGVLARNKRPLDRDGGERATGLETIAKLVSGRFEGFDATLQHLGHVRIPRLESTSEPSLVPQVLCKSDVSRLRRLLDYSDLATPISFGVLDGDTHEINRKASAFGTWIEHAKELLGESDSTRVRPTFLINMQTSRLTVLADCALERMMGPNQYYIGWSLYVPMMTLGVLPVFSYLSTLSKDLNRHEVELYTQGVYGNAQKEEGENDTACYLGHYLEFAFGDICETFKLVPQGPECPSCKARTQVVRNAALRGDADGTLYRSERTKEVLGPKRSVDQNGGECPHCQTRHWQFRCPRCGQEFSSLEDFLWLPIEIYLQLERRFLEIPHSHMLTKRVAEQPSKTKARLVNNPYAAQKTPQERFDAYLSKTREQAKALERNLDAQWKLLDGEIREG